MAWFSRLLAGGLTVLLQAAPGLAEDGTSWPRMFDAHRPLVPWVVPDGYGAFGGQERIAFAYQRRWFGGPLGPGVEREVMGARLRLVADQDTLLPQLAIGMQYRVSADPVLVRAMGGRDAAAAGADVSATKLFLAQGLLLNATLRLAHGDRPQFEAGAARPASREAALGAWFVDRDLSLVLAYAELGGVARQGRQNGLYLSLQAGF